MFIQEDHFKNIFNTVREAILVLDKNMKVLSANRSFYTMFKVDSASTIGSLLYDLGNGQWNIPSLRLLLEDILPKNNTVENYAIEHNFESIGQKTMLLNACKIREKNIGLPIILLAIEDITERREIERGLEISRKELVIIKKTADEASEFAESVINTVREPLISLDQDLRVVTVSRSFYEFFKVKPEETVGQLIYDLGNKQWDIPKLRELLENILPQKTTFDNYEVEHDFVTIGRRIMLLNARQIERGWGKERIILLAIEDITERKQLEHMLTESEERYRRVFETASDSIVLLEKRDGTIIQANPAAEKMLGYAEAEYTGKKLQDIGISLDMSDFPAMMQSLNKSGILNYDAVQVKTRSGQDIYADIYMVDRAKLAQCNIRDVSDRKLKEVDIQRLNRILVARSNSSKALISASDESWYLNEVCRIIFEDCGYGLVWIGFAEQDAGRTVRPVAHAGIDEGYLDAANITWSDTERGRGPVGTAIRTGKPSSFHNIDVNHAFAPWRKEAVKRGFAAIIGVPLLAEGKAFGSLNIYSRQRNPFSDDEVQLLTDLAADLSYGIATIRLRTTQTEAGLALRESEERFRLAIQATKDGIWEWNILTNHEFFSPRWCEIIGYSVDDPEFPHTYKSWAERIHPDDYERVQKALTDHLEKRTKYDVDYRHRHKSGEYRWQNSTGEAIFDESGKPTKMVGCISDITERKKAEEDHKKLEDQLRQAQKMESIGTLAGGIAHDFNNILTAIVGYGHIALMKMAKDDPQRVNIEHMLEGGERAAQLTKSLLLFSRKQISDRKPVDLNEVIRTVDKFLKRVIGEDVECKTSLFEEALPISGDSHQLEQVLMNLAANARDAMSTGGIFTITTERVRIDEEFITIFSYGKPGLYGLITISDTGKGMDAATREHIFEPFYTTKEVGKGTGLGLSIVYGVVKQHEGFINVYSEPGHGTSFKIYLPLISASVKEKIEQVEEHPRGGMETILLAEDDAAVRTLTREMLEEFGYTVIVAVDGQDGVNKFKENKDRIKLLLFDMVMPKKTGKEAYDEIRAIKPDIKILFQSGYAPDLVRQKLLLEDKMPVVFKPVTPMMLLKQVRSVLDQVT